MLLAAGGASDNDSLMDMLVPRSNSERPENFTQKFAALVAFSRDLKIVLESNSLAPG